MSAEWPLVRLGDHIEACLGKMLDKKKNKGILQPYLGNSNVRWGSFDLTDLSEMRFEAHEQERYGLKCGDLVVCEGGEPGRCAIWQDEVSDMRIQKALHRIRTKEGLNNYYLYYWFMLSARVGALEPYFTGTTIKHLTGKALNNLYLHLPPKKYQDAVASILRSLDDKIQLNHQVNQTLEQMAQAIFKSWFVDFEPVKAKMEAKKRWQALQAGNEPASPVCYAEPESLPDLETYINLAAMQAISGKTPEQLARMEREQPDQYARLRATAELFPSAMQSSELGDIPEGWEVSEIGKEVNVVGGGTPSTKNPEFWEGGNIHWTTPKDLSNLADKVLINTDRKITSKGLEKISSGLLPVDTVLMSSRAPVGYLALAKIPVAVNQGYIAMKCEKRLSPEYVIHWASANMDEIKSRASGTTFAEISKKNFKIIPVIVPTDDVVSAYSLYVKNMYSEIEAKIRESHNLANLRDTLLPKLLSGEISLNEA